MIQKAVSVPIRVGLTVTRTTLGLSFKVASWATGEVVGVVQSHFTSAQPGRSSSTSATPSRTAPVPEPAPPVPEPAPPAPAATSPTIPEDLTAPDQQPDTPLTPQESAVKTVDDEDEIVAEFAEVGAEDGAGAELHLEAPWEGYDADDDESVTTRIAHADAAELAMLELYEQTHRQRRTVLEAAERRLGELSPPGSA